eukprot:TRINITY_DN3170_c0_g1_i1.p1 TRINITY_DN3170_c0_g1~~TRINITY_DN3170_c0_g1_i1.p1  ORF type:complete len:1254 (-),score=501.85 TRINITY_DN3170_c0_g1_i1:25-3786(-)
MDNFAGGNVEDNNLTGENLITYTDPKPEEFESVNPLIDFATRISILEKKIEKYEEEWREKQLPKINQYSWWKHSREVGYFDRVRKESIMIENQINKVKREILESTKDSTLNVFGRQIPNIEQSIYNRCENKLKLSFEHMETPPPKRINEKEVREANEPAKENEEEEEESEEEEEDDMGDFIDDSEDVPIGLVPQEENTVQDDPEVPNLSDDEGLSSISQPEKEITMESQDANAPEEEKRDDEESENEESDEDSGSNAGGNNPILNAGKSKNEPIMLDSSDESSDSNTDPIVLPPENEEERRKIANLKRARDWRKKNATYVHSGSEDEGRRDINSRNEGILSQMNEESRDRSDSSSEGDDPSLGGEHSRLSLESENTMEGSNSRASFGDSNDFESYDAGDITFLSESGPKRRTYPRRFQQRTTKRKRMEKNGWKDFSVETQQVRKDVRDMHQKRSVRLRFADPIPPKEQRREKRILLNPGHLDDEEDYFIPTEIAIHLEPHQIEAIQMMWYSMVNHNIGFILALHMGLGKTFTTIAFLYSYFTLMFKKESKKPRVLVTCNPNLIPVWVNEFAKWTPNFKVFVYNNNHKERLRREWVKNGGAMIVGYQLYSNSVTNINDEMSEEENQWCKSFMETPDVLVMDEAHCLKYKWKNSLDCVRTKKRIVITGTPMKNFTDDLFYLYDCAVPKYMGEHIEFREKYSDPINKGGFSDSTDHQKSLAEQQRKELYTFSDPIVFRRGDTYLRETIPLKKEYVVYLKLDSQQREFYPILFNHLKELKSGSVDFINIYHTFCWLGCHPKVLLTKSISSLKKDKKNTLGFWQEIVDKGKDFIFDPKSPKLEVTHFLVEQSIKVKEKIIIFTQSQINLELVSEYLETKSISFLHLNPKNNLSSEIIRKFTKQDSKYNVLLMGKSGSEGIDFSMATRLIIFDPSWSPSQENQAISRIFRKGQTKPTFVYRLIGSGTFEENIAKRAMKKKHLSDKIVDKQSNGGFLTEGVIKEFVKNWEFQDLPPPPSTPIDDFFLENLRQKSDNPIHHIEAFQETFETEEPLDLDDIPIEVPTKRKRLTKGSKKAQIEKEKEQEKEKEREKERKREMEKEKEVEKERENEEKSESDQEKEEVETETGKDEIEKPNDKDEEDKERKKRERKREKNRIRKEKKKRRKELEMNQTEADKMNEYVLTQLENKEDKDKSEENFEITRNTIERFERIDKLQEKFAIEFPRVDPALIAALLADHSDPDEEKMREMISEINLGTYN